MKIFWKAQTLEMAESNIFFAKSAANHEAAIQNWLRLSFAGVLALSCPEKCPPKCARKDCR